MADEADDILKKLYKQALIEGVATEVLIERAKAAKEAAKLTSEAIDFANQIADGDPHKQKLADTLKSHLIGGVQRVTTAGDQEGRTVGMADPFSSPDASTSLEASGGNSNGQPNALPNEPPKSKRGRPPGSKNKPNG